jgi:hypothetical protein
MDVDKSQQVYKLADATFKNIEDFVREDLSSLVASAKQFHRALLGALEASESFYSQLTAVGSKATHLPGGVRQLGETIVEMASTQKLTNQALIGWVCYHGDTILVCVM